MSYGLYLCQFVVLKWSTYLQRFGHNSSNANIMANIRCRPAMAAIELTGPGTGTGTGTRPENVGRFKNVNHSSQHFTTANDHAKSIGIPRGGPKHSPMSATPTFFAHPWGYPLEYIKYGADALGKT